MTIMAIVVLVGFGEGSAAGGRGARHGCRGGHRPFSSFIIIVIASITVTITTA